MSRRLRPTDLHLLHHGAGLLAVVKPAGLPTVPDDSGDPSLYDVMFGMVRQQEGDQAFLGVVQRLDRPVSGVVVLARTPEAAADLTDQLRRRRAGKTYWGVTEGIPRRDEGRLVQWLSKDGSTNTVRSVKPGSRSAKEAVTRWRVLTTLGERALLELQPETGRSHQLRVACAHLGCPLVGDRKYGASKLLRDRSIGLHALRLAVEDPAGGGRLELEAPLPEVPLWNLGRRHLDALAAGDGPG